MAINQPQLKYKPIATMPKITKSLVFPVLIKGHITLSAFCAELVGSCSLADLFISRFPESTRRRLSVILDPVPGTGTSIILPGWSSLIFQAR